MKAAEFRKEKHGLSLIIGVVLLSILPLPLGAFAVTTPAPKISVSPASLNFTSVKVGAATTKTVTVKNTGTADLVLGSITFDGTDAALFGQTNNCPSPIAAGGTCTVTATFLPTIPYGKKSATMTIPSNDTKKSNAVIKLSGQAPPPVISASPASVNLSATGLDIPSAASSVTIKNTGISDLNIGSVTITGTNAAEFSMTDSWGAVVAQGGTTGVDVTFKPLTPGTKSAVLQILSDDPKKSTVNVKLTGKTSTSFSMADLSGTWIGNGLGVGPQSSWWFRLTLAIAADGTYTSTRVDSDGNSKSSSGKFSITSDGKITDSGNPNMLCALDAGMTVVACTDTRNETTPAAATLAVITRKSDSYAQSELAGTWTGNALAAGTGTNWWTRLGFTIAADGSYSGSFTDSDSSSGPLSGTFGMTADGVITDPTNFPNMLCTMDAGKTVVACTDSPDTGAVQVATFTKQGEAFALADLAGTWAGNSVATGSGAPWWKRVSFVIKPDGTYTSTKTFMDGSSQPGSGTLLLTADGVMKFSDDNNVLCQVDANMTVVACTKTWTKGLPTDGTTELQVITRKLK